MPKKSSFAIALGLHAQSTPRPQRNLERFRRAGETPNAADGFYFQLETFLDTWRREGAGEEVVRDALKRAEATSLAMEDLGKRLIGSRSLRMARKSRHPDIGRKLPLPR